MKAFRTLAGGLLWLARCTRPDIAFTVHQMTRRTYTPRVADMRLGKRVLRYLVGTASAKLYLKQNTYRKLVLSAYTDADYAARESDHKSISAAAVRLIGLLVNCYCKKQNNVSLSTIESEFVASTRCVQDLLGCTNCSKKLAAQQHSLCHCTWTIKPLSRRSNPKPRRNDQSIST